MQRLRWGSPQTGTCAGGSWRTNDFRPGTMGLLRAFVTEKVPAKLMNLGLAQMYLRPNLVQRMGVRRLPMG